MRGNFHASAALPSGKNCSRHPLNSGLSVSRGRCGCFRDVAGLLLLLSEIRRTLGRADYSLVSIPTVKSQTNLQNKLEWFSMSHGISGSSRHFHLRSTHGTVLLQL